MNVLWLIFLYFGSMVFTIQAQVPSYGSTDRIDLASWNLFWYGHVGYGSTNKMQQRKGIGEVLRNSRIDIWFFQEITDTGDFSELLTESGEFRHSYAVYWQNQKTAWVWDASAWTFLADSMLFQDEAQDFASGRLPLMTVLKAKTSPDTLFLVGIHLKANTGSSEQQQEAYENRTASAQHLKAWQKAHDDRKVIIAGDWNDDIDKSIYHDTLSPFRELKDEGHFLLEEQSLAGQNTWYYGTACIDHIWANQQSYRQYIPESSEILPLDWYFTSYPTVISDHFPVFAAFEWDKSNGLYKAEAHQPVLWPNPSLGKFYMDGFFVLPELKIIDMQGREVPFKHVHNGTLVEINVEKKGIHTLFMSFEEQVFVYRLVVTP